MKISKKNNVDENKANYGILSCVEVATSQWLETKISSTHTRVMLAY